MINKRTNKEYGNQFAYSDLHHNHGNIMKYDERLEFLTAPDLAVFNTLDKNSEMYRKWKPSFMSMKNMENEIIKRANAVVGENDTLWFLGDFSFAKQYEDVKKFRDRFVCKDIRIVWGNHDDRSLLMPIDESKDLFTRAYDATMIYQTPEGTFDEDEVSYDREINKYVHNNHRNIQRFYLSHYCHAVWEGSHKGNIHLYGHSHTNMVPWTDEHIPNALSLDVGCMGNNYTPYNLNDIKSMMKVKAQKGVHAIDHHNQDVRER